jgi:hypothetical protein
MEKIAAVNTAAAEYLRSITASLWSSAHFLGTWYGHLTSNIAELVNKILREDRRMSITELLNAIWHRVMESQASRLVAARKQTEEGCRYTSFCQTKLAYARKWAQSNQVRMLSVNEAQVIQSDGVIYLVDLRTGSCGCGRYAENRVPCSHAMAFIFSQEQSIEPYLPAELSLARQIAAYEEAMPPVDIAGLKPYTDDDASSDHDTSSDHDADSDHDPGPGQACNPPFTRVPRGRPRKRRLDKANFRASRAVGAGDMLEGGLGAPAKRVVYCSTCREPGHYARTCRRAHN